MSLLDAARQVRENAYAPYSKFKVGAALRTRAGTIFQGVNVENVAYPEGTCAEAGAIAAMIAAGETEIAEVAVIADSPSPVPPCGGCRQKIAEFAAQDVKVTLGTTDGDLLETTVGALLPGRFDMSHMDKV
ncbi:cytidine deaminase [Thioclava sp. BHET1]|uniref:Cytidine deaminase n=1 Tax=Thioclava dalianensis TaxID=1185766 RepID=A0A074TF41_9RHOB|nr:cytidine deaminase [Thioclava dalianensis]KEP70274.1 cytidine deaminase [Thioclava dalianensis]TMV90501.1 cytidine deaminase [Thioclava sp. BHET1]SFM83456.1 cytidine deaminase [Thioclava dalianensis]